MKNCDHYVQKPGRLINRWLIDLGDEGGMGCIMFVKEEWEQQVILGYYCILPLMQSVRPSVDPFVDDSNRVRAVRAFCYRYGLK